MTTREKYRLKAHTTKEGWAALAAAVWRLWAECADALRLGWLATYCRDEADQLHEIRMTLRREIEEDAH